MRERATVKSFNPRPMREVPPIPLPVPVEEPHARWSRRRRISVAAAVLLSVVLALSLPLPQPIVQQQSRPAQPPPMELHFPNAGRTTAGTTMWFTPSEAMAPDQGDVAPWPVHRAETWVGLGCHNDRWQGVGAGHDIVVTLWRGSSPTAMQPTMLRCPIIGADAPYQKCFVPGEVAFAATDWAKLEAHVGERVIEAAEGFSCMALIGQAG